MRRDVLDATGLRGPRKYFEQGLLEQLRKARHVHAGAIGREIGHHRKLSVEDGLLPANFEPHDALHTRNADAVDRELDVGFFFLTVREEIERTRLLYDAITRKRARERADRFAAPRLEDIGCDLRQRNHVERTLREVGMRQLETPEIAHDIIDE